MSTTVISFRYQADAESFFRTTRKVEQQVASLGSAAKVGAVFGAAFAVAERAVGLVTNALGGGVRAIAEYSSRLQSSKIAWTQFLGSGEDADALMLRMQQRAAKSPFAFEDVERGTQRLVAMNFTLKESETIMDDAITVSSGFGKGVAGVDSLTIALGQMNSSGHVYAQDMNQLIAVGVPAWQILADATGQSVAQTRKQAEEGKITSDVMLAAFHAWAGSKFGDVVAQQSRTATGALSTIRDNLLATGARAFAPAMEGFTALANRIADFTSSPAFGVWASKVAAVLAVVIANVAALAGYFASGLGAVLNVVTGVGQAIYDALSWINPFATHSPSLVSQVEDGVAVIMQAYSRLPGIGGPLGAAADAVRAFAAVAAGGMADYEAAQDQATANTLAIFGADVPAAYLAAKAAIGQLQQSLIPLQAAITAQEGVVVSWEQAVKSTQSTLDAEKQQLAALEQQLGTLQAAYDNAKKRVEDFAKTPLAGTKALEDQIFAVEQQALGVQLALAQWKVSPATLASIAAAQAAVAAQQGVVDDWSARVAASEQAVKGQEAAVAAAEQAQIAYANAVKTAQGAIEAQKERIAAANATLGAQKDALAAAQKQLAEYGKAQLSGTQAFQDRLFALDMEVAAVQKRLIDLKLDPALNAQIAATEGAIVAQTAAIADAERGMKGYDRAVEAAKSGLADQQAALADNRATLDTLTASLKKAQDAIKGFAGTDIKGTKAFEDQLFALDQQAAAVKLQMNTLLLGGATKKDPALNALQDQLDAINLQAENVNLQKQLQLDPLKRQVNDLANATKELTFDEIVKGIKAAQGQEGDLTKKLADANGAYAAQQAVVDGAQQALVAATAARDREKASIDASKDALAGLNEQLAALKATQAPKELTDQLANLQDRASQVKLAERLELEPLRRQIALLLNPVKEMSFAEITGGIASTRQTIAGLEQQVASSTTAWEREKAALIPLEASLKDAERARDDHTKVIDREKATLAGLQGALAENRAGYAGAKDELEKYNAALKAAQTAPQELTDALQALQDRADLLKLAERVQFDPLRKQIEDLAHPVKELTFEEITNGIRAAQAEMAAIDPQIAAVTAQIAAQKGVVDQATAAHDAATARLAAERETLDGLKKQYADITGQIQAWEQSLTRVTSAASGATKAAEAASGPVGEKKATNDIDLSEQKKQLQDMSDQYNKTKKEIEDRVTLWKNRLTAAYGFVRERIIDVRDTVMGVLGPAFDWIDKNVTPVVERFAGFVRDNFPAIAQTIAIVAAGFAAFSILSTVGAWIASLVGFWGVLSVAIEGVGGIAAALVVVLGGPLTLAIAAVVGIVTLLGVAWANNWGDIQGKVAAVWAWLQPVLADLGARLSAFWTDILPQLSAAWDSVSTKVIAAATWLWTQAQAIFGAVAGFLVAHGDQILAVLGGAWALIQNTINTYLGVIGNLIRGVLALISGDWDGAWAYIQNAARIAWDAILAFFTTAGPLIGAALDGISATVNGWGVALHVWIGDKFSAIGATIRDRVTQYKNDTGQQFSDMGTAVRDKLTQMKNDVGDKFSEIGTGIQGKLAEIQKWWSDGWAAVSKNVTDTWDGITSAVGGAFSALGTATNTFITVTIPGKFRDARQTVVDAVMGIFQGAGSVLAAFGKWEIDRIADVWQFIGTDVPAKFSAGLAAVKNAFMGIFEGTGSVLAAFGQWERDRIADVWQFIATDVPAKFTGAVKTVRDAAMTIFDGAGSVKSDLTDWMRNRAGDLDTFITVTVPGKFTAAIQTVRDAVLKIFDGAGSVKSDLDTWATNRANDLGTFITVTIPGKFMNAVQTVRTAAMTVFDGAGSVGAGLADWFTTTATATWTFISVTLPGKFTDAVEKVKTAFMGIFTAILAPSSGGALFDWFTQSVAAVDTFISAHIPGKFTEKYEDVRAAFMGIWSKFLDAAGNGTLGTWFTDTVNSIGAYIGTTVPDKIKEFSDRVSGAVLSGFVAASGAIAGVLGGFGKNAVGALNTVLQKVRSFAEGIRLVINWVAEKLGAGGIVGELPGATVSIDGLATGTQNWGGGMAWVGEGPGGAGAELAFLPKGAQVMTHAESMALVRSGAVAPPQSGPAKLPGFAGGLDALGGIVGVLQKGAGWLYDQAKGAVGLGDLSLPGALGDIGGKLAGKVKDWALGSIDKMLKAATPKAPTGGASGEYVFPVPGYENSFGRHWDGSPSAADIMSPEGSRMVAVRGGRAGGPQEFSLGGNTVTIAGDDGLQYYYAHLRDPAMVSGAVKTGQQVGWVGRTGNAYKGGTGEPHLHIGIGPEITSAGDGGSFDAYGFLKDIAGGKYATKPGAGDGSGWGGASGNGVVDAILGKVGNDSYTGLAMLMGSHMEGGWGPTFGAGDGGKSFGPYQIYTVAHPGVSRAQAEDPVWSTNFMYPEYFAASRRALPWGTDPAYAGARAAYYAERPFEMYPGARIAGAWGDSRGLVGMADGGVITEPIVGRGVRSGRGYTFGENGKEGVFNADQMAALGRGGGETHIHHENHYTIQSTEPTVTVEGLKREQRRQERLRGYDR